jgi:hypothetical protein
MVDARTNPAQIATEQEWRAFIWFCMSIGFGEAKC